MLIWYAFIYCLVPLFYFENRENYYQVVYQRILSKDSNFIFESIIVLLGFIGFLVGYSTLKKNKYRIDVKLISDKKVFTFALYLAFISILTYTFFISQYGGIDYVLSNVSTIRSGSDDNKSYLGAFSAMFSSLGIVSFLLLLYLRLTGYFKKKNIIYHLAFLLVALFVFFRMSFGGGRAALISIFIYILLEFYFLEKKINKLYLFGVVTLALFIVFFGKVYIFSLFSDYEVDFEEVRQRQGATGYMKLFVYEFNHQFLSLSNYVENNVDWRYLKDYAIWSLKPMRFFTDDKFYDSISYFNTYHINGEWESNIPPGSVAMAYINGGVFGVLMQSFIVGRIVKWLDLMFSSRDFKDNGILLVLYLLLFNTLWYALQNGDLALIVQGNIAYIALVLLLILNGNIRFKRFTESVFS